MTTRGVPDFAGARLARARQLRSRSDGKVLGLSLAELAELAGLNPRQVIAYEQGQHAPFPAQLCRLADILAVPPRELCAVAEGQERLVHLRCWAGLTLADTASAMGWSRRTTTAWEETGRLPRTGQDRDAVLRRAAEAYGCPVGLVERAWTRTTLTGIAHKLHV